MQIAAFLGFKNIYLIGVDFNYIEPKSVIKNGDVWTSTTDIQTTLMKDILEKVKGGMIQN